LSNVDQLVKKMGYFIGLIEYAKTEFIKDCVPEDLTPLQYKMIDATCYEGYTTVSRLTRIMDMSMPNCSREVNKLIKKGYFTKKADPDDKRKQRIHLTEVGHQNHRQSIEKIHTNMKGLLSTLPQEDVDTMVNCFEDINKIFKDHVSDLLK